MVEGAFPTYLPPSVQQLTEATSIALAHSIQQVAIATPLSVTPIPTTYVRQGQGKPPILLVHGFDSSVLEYRRLLPQLASYTETWAIDLLGFGFTERRVGLTFDAAQIKSHLYHTWKTLIQTPVVLVGASMGGAAAIDFALTYPEAVTHLVLLDSAGANKAPSVGRFLVPPLGFLAAEFLRNPVVRQRISRAAYADKTWASVDAARCAALHLTCPGWNRAMVAFTRSGGYNVLTQEMIRHLSQPTLILWGRQDEILGTADAAVFDQLIPDSQLIWIDPCGHVPHLEQPNETARHILNFLQLAPDA